MDSDERTLPAEMIDDGYTIEIYTDERLAESLAEDKLTAEQKKRLEEKLRQPSRSDP